MSTAKKRLHGRLHGPGYVAMLARILKADATTLQVCEAIGRPRSHEMRVKLRQFRKLELIHICAWKCESGKGKLVPVWRFGPGDEPPYPAADAQATAWTSSDPKIGVEMLAFANFIHELQAGDATVETLVSASGWIRYTTDRMVRCCRGSKLGEKPAPGFTRLAYVSGWQRREGKGGSPRPLYSFGDKPDVPRIKPLTSSFLSKKNYRRVKALKLIHMTAGTPANNQTARSAA